MYGILGSLQQYMTGQQQPGMGGGMAAPAVMPPGFGGGMPPARRQ